MNTTEDTMITKTRRTRRYRCQATRPCRVWVTVDLDAGTATIPLNSLTGELAGTYQPVQNHSVHIEQDSKGATVMWDCPLCGFGDARDIRL